MDDPFFSIVVPTFRRPAALRETLTALVGLDYRRDRYELIVVDDGADQITEAIVNEVCDEDVLVTLESQYQRGAACARNRGAQVAEGTLVLFIDDDIVVDPLHLRHHVATSQRHGDAIVSGAWEFAPAVVARLGTTPFGRYRMDLERHFAEETGGEPCEGDPNCFEMHSLGSWDLAVRRELFWGLGGFDESFPGAGAEDQDFTLRARASGTRLLLDTQIRCLHNDDRLTLHSYCMREERNAETMPYLARNHPQEFGEVAYVRENRPIQAEDPPGLVAKKLLKGALAHRSVLNALQRLVGLLESMRVPDRLLRRIYGKLLGLHLYRGFRRALQQS